jgi:hypothetical protein
MKNRTLAVNITRTFFIRQKCKFCGSEPVEHFYYRNDFFKDYKTSKNLGASLLKIYPVNTDVSMYYPSSNNLKGPELKYNIPHKSYNCSYHKNKSENSFRIINCLACKCGLSIWLMSKPNYLEANKNGKYYYSRKIKIEN